MNSFKLGIRLSKLKDICQKFSNEYLYDFCCDHGHLGLSLKDSNSFDKIILVDVVRSITEKLSDIVADIPDSKLKVVLDDCTKIKIDHKNSKTVVIAGIGGKLSTRIVENLRLQLNENDIIILSAHNNLEEVRDYLIKANILLVEEYLITDNSKYYEILVLSKTVGKRLSLVGDFLTSEQLVKKDYFNKCIKYFETKAEHTKSEKSLNYLELYKRKLEEINL